VEGGHSPSNPLTSGYRYSIIRKVIQSFGNQLAEDLYDDKRSRKTRSFAPELYRSARRKLLYVHDAAMLGDFRVPPGNHLESLKGEWAGFYSIRINDQWWIVFRWEDGHAHDVYVIDYH
jgi:toxin HigB-1